ncbi:MAG: dehydrogenase [Verrucomicrobia bacterium]|nr:dehydrogenase [Verrucomicrobiota bacterium]
MRGRAPLRLGFGGGGSDVPAYSSRYGGCILNITISMFAYASVETRRDGRIGVTLGNMGHQSEHAPSTLLELKPEGPAALIQAILSRFSRKYGLLPPINLHAWSDAPPGSGLGSSSTLVVAVCAALAEVMGIALGEYDVARLAYEIERLDLGMAGGQQDQYAAAFGGVNFMEFHEDGGVLVNPLRVKESILNELESSLLLYYTGVSRESAKIIQDQIHAAETSPGKSLEALHRVKKEALALKKHLLVGDLKSFYEAINAGWLAKKDSSHSITNPMIEKVVSEATRAGAVAAKVSGAGGGGFIMFFVPPEKRTKVANVLLESGGQIYPVQFTKRGVQVWTV